MLRLRVLGLVIVVPRLAWRPWPRLNGDVIELPDVGVIGEMGCDDPVDPVDLWETVGDVAPLAMADSIAALIPLGDGDTFPSSLGVAGDERCGATSSGSTRSGGRRSFSMSDLRLPLQH